MKKLYSITLVAAMACASLGATAGTTDRDGMPVIYLRGDFNNTGWGATDQYKFTRSGNDYTLEINSRNAIGNCEFKISNDDWTFNLGADVTVKSSLYVNAVQDGPNMKTSGMRDAVISFTYNPEAYATDICFTIDGVTPEPPADDDTWPEVYLRGDFNSAGWMQVSADYKFRNDGNLYTLDITSDNPVGPGSSFKIGDKDWKLVDLGAPEEGMEIDYTQTIRPLKGGPNFKTVNGIYEATISFTLESNGNGSYYVDYVGFTIPGTQKPPVSGLSGTLPVLYINVYTDESHQAFNNEINSKDLNHKNYFENAEYWLDLNGCEWMEELGAKSIGSEEEPLPLQIKARGNWTRIGFSKKPFKLKLDKKQSLLGLSKSKHFAILAHADDNGGYLRNFIGFNLGQRIGLPWTPSQQPVEVVVNGDYRGLYFLTESIRVEEDRVNITELGDNEEDGSLLSGGYIVELDNYEEANQISMEEKHCAPGWHYYDTLRVTFDTPEEYSDLQRYFITQQFSAMNDYVGANDDRLWSYLDLDDAARYYLVEEIVSNTESYHGSTYLFRDYGDGQKWHFSPLWDFGNAFNGHTDDYFYNCDPFGNTWIPSIRENSKFNSKVKETWLWFMQNEFDGVEDDIDEFVGHVTAAARADYNRWNGQPVPSGGQPVADNRDMQQKRNNIVGHLNSKVNWLKGKFGDYTQGLYAEPDRDDTPAAELPKEVATNVVEVIDTDLIGADTEYYNLQGIRIASPAPGTICIVKRGNVTKKVKF